MEAGAEGMAFSLTSSNGNSKAQVKLLKRGGGSSDNGDNEDDNE